MTKSFKQYKLSGRGFEIFMTIPKPISNLAQSALAPVRCQGGFFREIFCERLQNERITKIMIVSLIDIILRNCHIVVLCCAKSYK